MTFTLEELIAIGRAASRQPDREFAPDELEFIHDVARFAAEKASAKKRLKRMEAEGMAECMDMVRNDLVEAGVIDKSVPPMMVPEAVYAALSKAAAKEREACALVCDAMWDRSAVVEVLQAGRAIRARGTKEGV